MGTKTDRQIERICAELVRLRARLDSISGPGVVNAGRGSGIRLKGVGDGPAALVGGMPEVARFRISYNAPTDPATDDDADANVMLAKLWDGTNTGAEDVVIRTNQGHAVDDEVICVRLLNCARSNDGTELTFDDLGVGWEEIGGDPGLIPVNVTHAAGSNGTSSTAASLTYNVTDARTGTSIAGGPFAVTCSRVRNGPVTFATHGTGYYDTDGTFVLWWVDEKYGLTNC